MDKKVLKKASRSNMFYIVILVVTIIVLTTISLGVKFVKLLSDSSFKTPSFNVLILDQDARVVHVDRDSREISVFKINGSRDEIEKLSDLGVALTFRIPIDARITYDKNKKISDEEFFSLKHAIASLFNAVGADYKNMNSSDVLKMYKASRSVDSENITKIDRDKSYLKDPNKNIDGELSEAFRDEGIVNEQLSVEVINATGVVGFGSRMSRLLENAGYNVISIKNGESISSQIIDRTETSGLTQVYLSRFLDLPIKSDQSTPVADISIVFGK